MRCSTWWRWATRRIAMMAGLETHNVGSERRAGFFAAIEAAGLRADPALIKDGALRARGGAHGHLRAARSARAPHGHLQRQQHHVARRAAGAARARSQRARRCLDRRLRRHAVAGGDAAAADVHRAADLRHRRHRGAPAARAHRRAQPPRAARRPRDGARDSRLLGPSRARASRMRRRLVPLCLAALAAACTAREATPARPVVALVMKSLANEFFKTMEDGARRHQAANQSQYELVATGIKDEQDVSRQISLVEQMVARRVQAIVLAPADSKALVGVTRRAVDAGNRRRQHRQSSGPRRDGRAPAQRAVCGPRQSRRRPRRRPRRRVAPQGGRPDRHPRGRAQRVQRHRAHTRIPGRGARGRPDRSSDRRPPTGKRREPARSSRRW